MPDTLPPDRSLDDELAIFSRQRFVAMPLAGAIAWFAVAVSGTFLPVRSATLALLAITALIFPIGLLVARFTGEDLTGRSRRGNRFDRLFLSALLMAFLGYGVAIPFIGIDPSSAPLCVGILFGLPWIPLSWMIRHWIGYTHALARTILVVLAWYAFPAHRFVVIPAILVGIYLVSILVLSNRWRSLRARSS